MTRKTLAHNSVPDKAPHVPDEPPLIMAAPPLLDPRAAMTEPHELKGKARAIAAAKEMQAIVERAVKKCGIPDPQYEFLELIGKGAFGRVYKCKHGPTSEVKAVKIIDIDAADFKTKGEDTARDVLRETAALRTLKETKAKNINVIHDAFFLASYVWIVSEYCPGGSVHTLMRATPQPGLDEAYIIPIARELAEALKWVHKAGIIHRDVKAANILVCEDGRVQLCDFGIAGVLESKANKRTTILGTPHYMPPEMLDVMASNRVVHYGNEVDVWAFGCTLYELATGAPPNARVSHEHLRYVVREQAPRLEGSKYSPGLRELIAFCMEESPLKRPSIEVVQTHYYIHETHWHYPTISLKRLLYDYYLWERSGGQRASLFMPGGAPELEPPRDQDHEEWNFSTTEFFEKSLTSQSKPQTQSSDSHSTTDKGATQSRVNPQPAESHRRIPLKPLERLFIPDDDYNYLERGQMANAMAPSDLPLREQNENSSRRETFIDAGDFDARTGIATIPELSSIRGNKKFGRSLRDEDYESQGILEYQESDGDDRRATKDWTFPDFATATESDESRRRTQDWTFPVFASTGEEPEARRQTKDWKFPSMIPGPQGASDYAENAPTASVSAHGRPPLLHAATAPVGSALVPRTGQSASHASIDLDAYAAELSYTTSSPEFQFPMHEFGNPFNTVNDSMGNEAFAEEPEKLDFGSPAVDAADITSVSQLPDTGQDAGPSEYGTAAFTRPRAPSVQSQRSDLTDATIRASDTKQHSELNEWDIWDNQQTLKVRVPTGGLWDEFDSRNFDMRNYPHTVQSRPQTRLGDPDFPTMDRINAGLRAIAIPGDPAYVAPPTSIRTTPPRYGAGLLSDDDNEYEVTETISGAAQLLANAAGQPLFEPSSGHARHSSGLTSGSDPEYSDNEARAPNPFQLGPLPAPPSAAAMAEGADSDLLVSELERVLGAWMGNLATIRSGLEQTMTRDQRRAAKKAAKKAEKKAMKRAAKRIAEADATAENEDAQLQTGESSNSV